MIQKITILVFFLNVLPCFAQSPPITTVAGDGNAGFSGDWGEATRASLNSPWDVALYDGHIYIADASNHRIRKVDRNTGLISTVAGIGESGFWGTGGPATEAPLNRPWGLCVDSNGNIYIADRGNSKIRKVDAQTGIITTIAGRGNPRYSGDGGSALQADLHFPSDVFIDKNNNLYIADQFNNRIRKVDGQTGIITTIAGNGSQGFSGDGGPATQASLNDPTDVYVDTHSNVYFTARFDHRVRRIDGQTGIITTIAGSGSLGFSGDGGPATQAQLNFPSGVWGDQNNIYISDTFNNRIRKVDINTGIITTVAGNGSALFSGDGGPATEASLKAPNGIFVDATGHIYICDTQNHRIRRLDTNVPNVTVISDFSTQNLSLGGEIYSIDLENPKAFQDENESPLTYTAQSTNPNIAQVEINNHIVEITAKNFGTVRITITAQNTLGAQAQNSFDVTINNHAPTAVDDTITVAQNGRINIDVIPNDWDMEGDPFRVSDVRDGYQSERVVLNSDGTIHYRPNTDFVGTDYFIYKIQDQKGGKSQATVHVRVIPEYQQGFTVQEKIQFSPTFVGETSSYTISAQNPLQTNWTVSQITISGVHTSAFSVKPTAFEASPTDSARTILLTFAPEFDGLHTATLSIHHTASGTPLQISLEGQGLSSVIDSSGVIVTYAGLGQTGFEENKLATETYLNRPNWLATDTQGNVYIADRENKRIRMVNVETKQLETIAGNGDTGYWRNGADPKGTLLTTLEGIAVDSEKNIYITSHNWVWRIDAETGLIHKFAGAADGGFGYSGDGGAASKARIREPKGIAVDNQGNLYIADSRNHCIRKVDVRTGIITTVAGNGTQGHSGDGDLATRGMLFAPIAVHVDHTGNLYISDWGNNRIRKVDAKTGIITTIAGNGQTTYSGDGGQATQAGLSSPLGLLSDSAGNIYFSDSDHACIRKIDAETGLITTVIGDGRRGYTGDGGQAQFATLTTPYGLAIDAQGSLFIADTENHVIRKVIKFISPPTMVQRVIEDQPLAIGEAAQSIDLQLPIPIFLPNDGSLKIGVQSSDTSIAQAYLKGHQLFLKANNLGTARITLSAQNTQGKQTTTSFQAIVNNHSPQTTNDTLTVAPGDRVNVYVLHNDYDADGDSLSVIEVTDGQHSERVVINSDGSIHYRPNATFEGTDQFTYTIQDIHGSQSVGTVTIQYQNNDAPRLLVDGNLVFPSTGIGSLHTLTLTLRNPGITPLEIKTISVSGPNRQDFIVDAVSNVTVPANNIPISLSVIFMPQQAGNRTATLSFETTDHVTQIMATGTGYQTITTVAGSGRRAFDGDGELATDAAIQFPSALWATHSGDLYLADTWNNRIRKIDGTTKRITTIAGNGNQRSSGDQELGILASLNRPEGVSVDQAGNVYISDTLGNKIRLLEQTTGIISTYAGSGGIGFRGDGGPATSAQFYGPRRIFLTPSGDLYIADKINNRIRKVDAQTKTIVTVAGNGEEGYSGDGGPAIQASLSQPTSVWVDSEENIYIADFLNDRIRKVNAKTQLITTVAGNGNRDYSGDGGAATLATLNYPYDIAVDDAGNIFVADGGNNRIRRIDAQSGIISTLAGNGTGEASGDGGPAQMAGINHPRALCLDASGNLYISDSDNYIRKISRVGVVSLDNKTVLLAHADTLYIETNGKINTSLTQNDISNTTLEIAHLSEGIYTDRVVMNSDGTVHYRPKLDYKGIDRFTYIIRNNQDQTAVGHVIVYVGIQPTSPTVQTTISDLEIILDDLPFVKNLTDEPAIFIDEDGDPLLFHIDNTDTTVVDAYLTESILTIKPKNIGTTQITLTATDNHNNATNTHFSVAVKERISGTVGESKPESVLHALNTRFALQDVISLTGPILGDLDITSSYPLHFISTIPQDHSTNTITLLRFNLHPLFEHVTPSDQFVFENIETQTDSTALSRAYWHRSSDSTKVPVIINLRKIADHWLISNMPDLFSPIQKALKLDDHPQILNLIPDQIIEQNAPTFTRVLTETPPVFGTPDQRTLTFLASSSDTVAIAGVAQNRLSVTPVSPGHATITLTAIDSLGQQATFQFNVEVIPPTTPSADFNADGQINFADFLLFASAFGTNDPNYDLNGDGQVSFPDFIIFGQAFTP